MNIFILNQILTYIRRNFKVYFCVVIQFTIIIYLLNIFLSAYFCKKLLVNLDYLFRSSYMSV